MGHATARPFGPEPDRPARGAPDRVTPLRELQLLEAHRLGDPAAMSGLLEAYQGRIYAICYRMVRHSEAAADLAQDALVKVMEGIDSYDGRAALSTWVIRIAMNCCLSHMRRERLRRHGSFDPSCEAEHAGSRVTEPAPAQRVEHEQAKAAVRLAFAELEPGERAILVLRDLQDLDYRQIGEVLGVPLGTVKSRLFRARAALREAVEERESGGDPPSLGQEKGV